MVRGREQAPQALWVRVDGNRVTADTVELALVDRPDPVPDGYRLQQSWTMPVLVDEAHARALEGARVEYLDDGGFRVRLADEVARSEAVPAAPESGCTSCTSAALPEVEALRASMGRVPQASAVGASGRGPALPILGQNPAPALRT